MAMNKRDTTRVAEVVKALDVQQAIVQELANDASMREQAGRCPHAPALQEAWQQLAGAMHNLRKAAKLP